MAASLNPNKPQIYLYLYYCTACDDGYADRRYIYFTGDAYCPNCKRVTFIEFHGAMDTSGELHLTIADKYYENRAGGFHKDNWHIIAAAFK